MHRQTGGTRGEVPQRDVDHTERVEREPFPAFVYTTKHHYGWSGWPTAHGVNPKYNVATSSVPDLDTVKAVVNAARNHNLTPVLYYSLLDRYNYYVNGSNQNAGYTQFVKDQLSELLDGTYGDIPALWFDIGNALTDQQRDAIRAHARTLRPGIVLIINGPRATAPPQADLRIYEGLDQAPPTGAIDPTTSDRSVTTGTQQCDPGAVAGWWSFDNQLNPGCLGWTRGFTLDMRDDLNRRNSSFTLNVPPGPSGRLSTQAEAFLRSLAPADDRDPDITYTGTWHPATRDGAHLDTLTYAQEPGATATHTFSGTNATVETKLGPGAGIMNILIDGTKVATVDTWSPTHIDRAVAFTTRDLTPGQHTIQIVATGQKNPHATAANVHLDSIQHYSQ